MQNLYGISNNYCTVLQSLYCTDATVLYTTYKETYLYYYCSFWASSQGMASGQTQSSMQLGFAVRWGALFNPRLIMSTDAVPMST